MFSKQVSTPIGEVGIAKNISETKKQHQNRCRGFTLVEMLVSIGIFALLTGVVLAKYRTFDTNARFANASEDIVLALRQAQVYGVGVKGQGSSFTTPYGVYFDTATPNQIIIFADTVSPGISRYDAGSDAIIETITFANNIYIADVQCSTDGVVMTPCYNSNSLDVVFKRPNPDAIIRSWISNTGRSYVLTNITISNGVKSSTVSISNAGQISLQ